LIQKAFAKTGIYLLNPDIFNDQEFAPSKASLLISAFPPSYPHEILLSVPSESSEASGSLGDQDNSLDPSNDNHSHVSSPPSPPSEPASIVPHQTMLPILPPYKYVINQMPSELWHFMQLHQIQCKTILKEAIA
jgi:hypothetical protein